MSEWAVRQSSDRPGWWAVGLAQNGIFHVRAEVFGAGFGALVRDALAGDGGSPLTPGDVQAIGRVRDAIREADENGYSNSALFYVSRADVERVLGLLP